MVFRLPWYFRRSGSFLGFEKTLCNLHGAFRALGKRYAICMELSGLWENGIL
jgi:hypothetical protein